MPGITYVDRSGRPVGSVRYETFARLLDGRIVSVMRGPPSTPPKPWEYRPR